MKPEDVRRLTDRLIETRGLPADRAGTHSGLKHIRVTISPTDTDPFPLQVVIPRTTRDDAVIPHTVEIRLSPRWVRMMDEASFRRHILHAITTVIAAHPKWLTLRPIGWSPQNRRVWSGLKAWQQAMLAAGVPPKAVHKVLQPVLGPSGTASAAALVKIQTVKRKTAKKAKKAPTKPASEPVVAPRPGQRRIDLDDE